MLTKHRARSVVLSDQLANSVVQTPGGFQSDTQGLLKLPDGERPPSNKVDRLQPQMEVEVAGLDDSADLDRERSAARIALVGPATGALAL